MVLQNNTIVDCTIQLGQYVVPSFAWYTDVGTYGQMGRGMVKTSITALREVGLNLNTLNAQTPGANQPSAVAPDGINIPIQLSVNGKVIFGGYYMHGHYSFGISEAEIYVRDYASVLFDSQVSIAELNYQNVLVNDMVKAICAKKGLKAQVNSTLGTKTLVGTLFAQLGVTSTGQAQGQATMSGRPQTYWNLITFLARQVNAQVYTIPSPNQTVIDPLSTTPGTLVFTDIPASPMVNRYSWNLPPQIQGPGLTPLIDIDVLHQPQRNRSFAVVVKSHHQQSTQTSISTVTVNGQPVQSFNNKTIPAGFYTGTAGPQVRNLLSGKASGIPIYEFRKDGLTANGTVALAEEIANVLASKLLVENLLLDFDAGLFPLQQAIITEYIEDDLLGFADRTLYITGVRHSMGMPQGEHPESGGLVTTLKCLTLPPISNPMSDDDLSELLAGQNASQDPTGVIPGS